MDLEYRTILREYSINPTDELAHRLARLALRTNEDDLMGRFYKAYWWLQEHPIFNRALKPGRVIRSCFPDCLDIHVARVDPQTRRVEDDKARNTHIEVWLEVIISTVVEEGVSVHHWELDCGGDSFEEAVINLAKTVWERREHYQPHSKPYPFDHSSSQQSAQYGSQSPHSQVSQDSA